MISLSWKEWISLVKEWMSLRENSITIAKKIATIRNETSYLSNERIDQAIGSLMKPGRITLNVDSDFNLACKDLSGVHNEMTLLLEKILTITSQFDYNNNDNDNTCPVDKCCIDKVSRQLKQTMLLEVCIASNLSSVDNNNGYISNGNHLMLDNDVIVTLLACYTYPPYIEFKEIEALIAL